METKKCKQCQQVFLSSTPHHKFCSDKCRWKFHNSKEKSKTSSIQKSLKVMNGDKRLKSSLDIKSTNNMLTALQQIKKLLEKQADMREEYLVPKQVCQLLSFNRSTFDRYVEMGLFKLYRLGKGKVYVKRSEIDLLFQNQ